MLSKSCEAHFRLMSAIWSVRRGSIRFIKPSPEIPVHKEVHPQEGHEVGEAPVLGVPLIIPDTSGAAFTSHPLKVRRIGHHHCSKSPAGIRKSK